MIGAAGSTREAREARKTVLPVKHGKQTGRLREAREARFSAISFPCPDIAGRAPGKGNTPLKGVSLPVLRCPEFKNNLDAGLIIDGKGDSASGAIRFPRLSSVAQEKSR